MIYNLSNMATRSDTHILWCRTIYTKYAGGGKPLITVLKDTFNDPSVNNKIIKNLIWVTATAYATWKLRKSRSAKEWRDTLDFAAGRSHYNQGKVFISPAVTSRLTSVYSPEIEAAIIRFFGCLIPLTLVDIRTSSHLQCHSLEISEI